MKKFFLIAAAAAMVLSSCSKNTVSEDTSAGNAIGFGTYSNKATKSSSTLIANGSKLTNNTKFGVYGYLTLNTTYAAAATHTPAFMPNQYVTYATGTPDTYTYDPLRYWPKDESTKISFYAYYPYTDASNPTGITLASMPNKDTEGQGSFYYTVNDTPANQVDFMVSDFVKDQAYSTTNSGTPGLVKLTFHHMLTKVGVKVKTTVPTSDPTVVKVTKITLGGKLLNAGTLTPAPTATASVWSATSGATTYTILDKAAGVTLTNGSTEFTDLNPTAGDLLMIPQTLSSTKGDNLITIEYEYTTASFTVKDKATADLATGTATDLVWGMNNYIVYNLTLDLNSRVIRFTAEVTPWDTEKDINL